MSKPEGGYSYHSRQSKGKKLLQYDLLIQSSNTTVITPNNNTTAITTDELLHPAITVSV